jgi:hypothetical protein
MASHALENWMPYLGTIGLQARIDTSDPNNEEIVIWNVVDFDISKRTVMDVTYTFIPGNIKNGFSRTMADNNAIYASASYVPKQKDARYTAQNPTRGLHDPLKPAGDTNQYICKTAALFPYRDI